MAIDRIGKGTTMMPALQAPQAAERSTRPFVMAVERTGAVAESTPLEQLRSGAINVAMYLDQKIENATSHLHGLGKKKLEFVKDVLRNRLQNEPHFVELVGRVTAHDGAVNSLKVKGIDQ